MAATETYENFPVGRKRFIAWVSQFGHTALGVRLGLDAESGRKLAHSWTNKRAEYLVPPHPRYRAKIVELSHQHPLHAAHELGGGPLTEGELVEGAGVHFDPVRSHAYRFTVSGKRIDVMDPDMSLVCIEDIAGGLANIIRFGGAARGYTVAQHCCLGALYLLEPRTNGSGVPMLSSESGRRRRAYDFLMHDAHEYLLQDVISPIKRSLVGEDYREHERTVDALLARKFGYRSATNNERGTEAIHAVDMGMRSTEEQHFFGKQSTNFPVLPVAIEPWDLVTAEQRFLDLYEHLAPQSAGGGQGQQVIQ